MTNVNQNIKVVFHRIENIVGKEENAGYSLCGKGLTFNQSKLKAFAEDKINMTHKIKLVV